MNRVIQKTICYCLTAGLALAGCAPNAPEGNPPNAPTGADGGESRPPVSAGHDGKAAGLPFQFQVEPEPFTLSLQVDQVTIPFSQGFAKRVVADYKEEGGVITWRYPKEQIQIALTPASDYLRVEITSEKEDDNQFIWPEVSAEQYYVPFGEGKRFAADDPVWKQYLDQQDVTVLEQLSMPFWISAYGDYHVLFLMEDPYRTRMHFSAEDEISVSVSHEYPEIDQERTGSYRIYVTDNNPVTAAKLYRNYMMETDRFVTLEQKEQQNPNIEKLYGAPFVYLWGEFLISDEDVHWPAFRRSLDLPVMDELSSFSDKIENGKEFETVLEEVRGQDYVTKYQKQVILSYLSQLLKRDDVWNSEEHLTAVETIQANKQKLAAAMPGVFQPVDQWMDRSTVQLLRGMKESGVDRAWIGLNSWEQAYAKPELVEEAEKLGYLIASYDSYHSIHEPGKEKWITAAFEDLSLYENASITDKNGQKEEGFQRVGRKLNPVLSLPAVKTRMEGIMSNPLPFNSWFIDCDATGEIYDDYTKGRVTTQEQDLAARMERMSYIRDQYGLVIGSEGGNDFAAPAIAFAHGLELKSFSWMDEDMKSRKDSEYYIGKYYHPGGGTAEHFSKRIPVKEKYHSVFVDPKYDIPLFKLVYNDSVITSYHWDWSTFKIKGATRNRMVREVLYNVSPLYHLDAEEWERYKQDIAGHQKVWSDFSRKAVREELTDFMYLSEDGSVQKTVYGDHLTAVANFGEDGFMYGEVEIPPQSVWMEDGGQGMIYTPSLQEESR